MTEEPYKQAEVTYKFYLPDNEYELKAVQNSRIYQSALSDIHDKCRTIWKYKENATNEEVDLAESIGEMVADTGIFKD